MNKLIGRKTDLEQLICFCEIRIKIWTDNNNIEEFVKVYEDMRNKFAAELQEVELLLNTEKASSGQSDPGE